MLLIDIAASVTPSMTLAMWDLAKCLISTIQVKWNVISVSLNLSNDGFARHGCQCSRVLARHTLVRALQGMTALGMHCTGGRLKNGSKSNIKRTVIV